MDGLLRVKVEETLKRTASRLSTKWKEPYARTSGYVKSIVAITLVRATHRLILGDMVPASHTSITRPRWGDGAVFHLFW